MHKQEILSIKKTPISISRPLHYRGVSNQQSSIDGEYIYSSIDKHGLKLQSHSLCDNAGEHELNKQFNEDDVKASLCELKNRSSSAVTDRPLADNIDTVMINCSNSRTGSQKKLLQQSFLGAWKSNHSHDVTSELIHKAGGPHSQQDETPIDDRQPVDDSYQ